jgi:hypothetical protein
MKASTQGPYEALRSYIVKARDDYGNTTIMATYHSEDEAMEHEAQLFISFPMHYIYTDTEAL